MYIKRAWEVTAWDRFHCFFGIHDWMESYTLVTYEKQRVCQNCEKKQEQLSTGKWITI